MSSPGCAQGPDGKLLDASEITWYFDADDDEPLQSLQSQSKLPVSSTPQPAGLSGHRRSGRVTHPSVRACDPNNTVNTTTAHKRLRSNDDAPSRVTKRPIPALSSDASIQLTTSFVELSAEIGGDVEKTTADGEQTGTDADHGADTTEPEDLDDYATTKRMGDADHQVC
jgi:hypothetical protein